MHPPRSGEARGKAGGTGDQKPVAQADPFFSALRALGIHAGKPLDIADLQALLPRRREGATAKDFARAVERLGYRTRKMRGRRTHLRPPFLCLGAGGEAKALLLERRGDAFFLFDPATGKTRTEPHGDAPGDAEDILLLTPAPDRSETSMLRRLIGGRFRRVFFEILLASTMVNLFALATPLFVMTVYNKVIAQAALDTLNVLVIGMLTLYGFDAALRGIRGYIVSHTGARLDAILGGEAMRCVLNLPYRILETAPAGRMNERLRQIDAVRDFFAGSAPILLVDHLFILPFLAVLFFLSPPLGTIALIALPIFALLSFVLHRMQRGFYEDRFHALAARSSAYLESLRNALTVKSLGLEPEIERRFEEHVAATATTGFRAGNLTAIANAAGALLQQITALAIVFFGARLVIDGELSIGALVAANLLAMRALAPVRQTVAAWNQLQETRHAFRELAAFLKPAQQEASGIAPAPPAFAGSLRLEGLSFRYEPDAAPVLDRIQLELPKESIVAIVGPAGSGKSTLAKLLQGLYAPSEGRILIDETDIAHLSPAALHRQIGSVPQENQIFSGSVRDNLLFGLRGVPMKRAVTAAKFVGAHGFIQRLAKGYDTRLGENGQNLSAGQTQMICVARALVRNPKILLLDEATNALDPAAEKALLRKLRQTAKGHSILLLTNRLTPASIADYIALLVDGRIEGFGPRAEMIDVVRERLATLAKETSS
ncbi:MAG: hypothetical protein COA65_01980 [Rhodospirillaceae bacterium]|nr:MAG: hypothetical protein COA65_01980 [Rhodospirillaceae bacterium]